MLADRVHAEGGDVVDRGAEPDGLGDRRRAGLELPGDLVGREAVDGDLGDHLAAAHERGHGLEQLAPGPQRADAGRAAHLVGGERHEVGVPGLHVDREVRHGLARVDQHERAGGVGGVGERTDVVDRAEHVGHRAHREELGAVEQLGEVRQVEAVVGGEGDPPQLDAALGREDVPRHDVGVVLHVREHDGVALAEVGARHGARRG